MRQAIEEGFILDVLQNYMTYNMYFKIAKAIPEDVYKRQSMNRLLSVKEVAVLLQTSRVQVRRMIQSGELAALKVGREYRIPLAALEAFVQAALE